MESDLGPVIGEYRQRGSIIPKRQARSVLSISDLVIAFFGVLTVLMFIAVVIIAVVLTFTHAKAHGSANWIQRGGYKNSAGELCCGERDCFELSTADVKVTSAGYFVVSTKETIPFSEATPSPTGTYWRCQWGGSRKCFFAPPASY